jgi:uncharacterized protein YndB with AHSA1/START domain
MAHRIIKNITTINAPKERVWDVLTKDEYTRQWYAEFHPGTYADTTWKEGTQAIFTHDGVKGIIGTVDVNRPAEELIIRYEGLLSDGKPDYSSPAAAHVKNGYESYLLAEDNGITTLQTAASMSPEFMDMMGSSWDRAKDRIKQLAEA